ncbi:hypothetical protein G8J22_02413 [Lentilactobacillus hilgardii]|uniref:Uncharacterized protein n=1 Tax=Lentilactobacillus hilgardii (strain ATCC 8290 / DSM 20176 / CCUG 30140 / JCM 1155 / KCTC 3500 / NBRC 15886 / NCIMB 8040 / NRRL B-1843 / 9) TaxID=1423757 RepID=C0XGP2_LENH9|nr:hypothetical protein [Lentilactobacillus hilgardii]EEI19607.1 hypothetical protein HMPREF0497_1592 [Lentilactobacillus buchneri ATCC 11577]EEI25454.1 hypothetical protein HMPREF0519_0403 [Lentilactobacillus hilgardii DSM 20176 = ATCC 8290]QEU39405.1 hypothetical protein LH500_11280 [Lentilactobacillus hilgardii]QIR10405.1 hypothetical protein G8J22_02413 [Lentilactobacillus hilgardii]TDG85362.1 hypothetical protein C5L34_002620 [Lentilactobacillus hilgardii]
MAKFGLIEAGKQIGEISLPNTPRRGDVISNVDPKGPVYLVLRVEYVIGFEEVNLHVQTFANQLSAVLKIKGFRDPSVSSN